LSRRADLMAKEIEDDLATVFTSKTQAYREALLGSVLARLQRRDADLRLPYIKHGPTGYNAREIDQSVVNPFLKRKQIPSSTNPFLSSLRRGIKFTADTAVGIRDRAAFAAFVSTIERIGALITDEDLHAFLGRLLYKFLELREAANIPVAKVQRLSIPQYSALLQGLLATRSGGLFPVLIVLATLHAIKEVLGLPWEIRHQGLNEADAAAEQAGDITISVGGKAFIVCEVTERIVNKARVVSTFTEKIGPSGIEDYIFFVNFRAVGPDQEAVKQAQQYFNQGHEVTFVDIRTWALNLLVTFGKDVRRSFTAKMVSFLDASEVPRNAKVGWNERIQELTRV
jgi:hypothetical protein